MWERENMDDSARKTSFFSLIGRVGLIILRMGSWWNVAELEFCASNIWGTKDVLTSCVFVGFVFPGFCC